MKHFQYVAAAVLIVCSWTACNKLSENPSSYVGEYVFTPGARPPEGFANYIVLKPDQIAVEIRSGKDSSTVETSEKRWYLTRTTGENVVIGNFSCPIKNSGRTIRLMINGDLNQYYEKVR